MSYLLLLAGQEVLCEIERKMTKLGFSCYLKIYGALTSILKRQTNEGLHVFNCKHVGWDL